MNIDGIIFDLDGTLWDSSRAVSESWGMTLKRLFGTDKHPSREDVQSIMGMTSDGIARTLFADYGDAAENVCIRCIHEENGYIAEHGADVFDGTAEMLRALSEKYPLFIVSNCLDGYIECFLSSSGSGKYITDYECEGSTGLGKADNIRLLCSHHGIKSPVYVGDTVSDEESAAASGCLFVHAAYGFGSALAPAATAHKPTDIIRIITSLEGGSDRA